MHDRIRALYWVRSVSATDNMDWMLDGAKAVCAFLEESAKLGASEDVQDGALMFAAASLVYAPTSADVNVEPDWCRAIAAAHQALTWVLGASSSSESLPGDAQ